MSASITLSKDQLRDIILGKVTFRKCPSCDNNGVEYWCGLTGAGAGPFARPEWGENCESGDCENCDGLGYIANAAQAVAR